MTSLGKGVNDIKKVVWKLADVYETKWFQEDSPEHDCSDNCAKTKYFGL